GDRRRERRAGPRLAGRFGPRLGSIGAGPFGLRRRIRDRLDEAAFYALALAEDRIDVAGPHLLLEHRVRHADRVVRSREEHADDQEVHEQNEQEPEPGIAGRHASLVVTAMPACARSLGVASVPAPGLLHPSAQDARLRSSRETDRKARNIPPFEAPRGATQALRGGRPSPALARRDSRRYGGWRHNRLAGRGGATEMVYRSLTVAAALVCALWHGDAAAQFFPANLPNTDFRWQWGDVAETKRSLRDFSASGNEAGFTCQLTGALRPGARIDELDLRRLESELNISLYSIQAATRVMNDLD